MRLIHIISGLCVGGAERQVCDLADQFSALGHEIVIVSLTGEAMFLPRNKAIEIIQLRMGRSFLSSIKACIKIRKLILKLKPDVVHCHMFHAIIFIRLLRLIIPIRLLICTSHCVNEFSRYRMLAYKLTDRLTDLSTIVSEFAQEEFIREGAWGADRSMVIRNGIDTERFNFNKEARINKRRDLGLCDDTKLLLAVGRIVQEKDYPSLLRAFAFSTTERNDLRLVIIGTGKLLDDLLELARQLSIADKLFFLGERKDVEAWMSAADLFVLSSVFEGFGLVVAEAMATGLLVVSTDCGAVSEIVNDFGTIVQVGNEKALSKAILTAVSYSPNEQKRQAALAREYIIDNYSISFVARKWIELYKSQMRSSQS